MDQLWRRFTESGKVDAYLQYKKQEQRLAGRRAKDQSTIFQKTGESLWQ